MKHSRKVELLRQIRYVLTQEQNPSPRAVDLSLLDLQELQRDKLIEVWVADDSAVDELGNYRIRGLTDAGDALLAPAAASQASEFPAGLRAEKQQVLPAADRGFPKVIRDLLKIAAGVVIGWYLKKYLG